MLRLSLRRFSFILSIQISFLICDVVLNSVGPIFKEKNTLKFIFFFQDGEKTWLYIGCYFSPASNEEKENVLFMFILLPFSAFLLLSLAFLVYSCYSTYIYQAGLTSNKQDWQFRLPVVITLVYILLSLTVHVLTVNESLRVDNVGIDGETGESRMFVALFIVQKICECWLCSLQWIIVRFTVAN